MDQTIRQNVINHLIRDGLTAPLLIFINETIKIYPNIVLDLDSIPFDSNILLYIEYYQLVPLVSYLLKNGSAYVKNIQLAVSYRMIKKLMKDPVTKNQLDPSLFFSAKDALRIIDYLKEFYGLSYSCESVEYVTIVHALVLRLDGNNRKIDPTSKPWELTGFVTEFNDKIWPEESTYKRVSRRDFTILNHSYPGFAPIKDHKGKLYKGFKEHTLDLYIFEKLGSTKFQAQVKQLIQKNMHIHKIDYNSFIHLGLAMSWIHGSKQFSQKYINYFIEKQNYDPIHFRLLILLGYHLEKDLWKKFMDRILKEYSKKYQSLYHDKMSIQFLEILIELNSPLSLDPKLRKKLRDLFQKTIDRPDDCYSSKTYERYLNRWKQIVMYLSK